MSAAPHIPVLLEPVLAALQPLEGAVVVDGTFGAGGYSRAILNAGARRVIAIDRDPSAIAAGGVLQSEFRDRLSLVEGAFDEIDDLSADAGAARVDAVVLDVGVSSMQLDQAERGFSFLRDGPLDMRMSSVGGTAADLVNLSDEEALAEILYLYGEERASRRIAKAIVARRVEEPFERTLDLAELISTQLPRPKPGHPHPATRSFQALRIAVNDELGQLARALSAAERILDANGRLAVVTFHSLEDRIVKRFFQIASGRDSRGSRHMPVVSVSAPRFTNVSRPIAPRSDELGRNPRARSARLRAAVRTAEAAEDIDPSRLGLPSLSRRSLRGGRR